MNYTETWIAEETLNRITQLVQQVKEEVTGGIIEFGCWEGRSLTRIAEAAHPRIVHAVDHWQGNIGDTYTLKAVAERDVFQRFQDNISHLNNVQIHRESNDDFMKKWDMKIAFLHLDADHNYLPVKEQIEWAIPYLSQGAILCGDDYSSNWKGVVQAVDETLPARQIENAMWIYYA